MSHLPRDLRRNLENSIRRARGEAENGARASLHHLGVNAPIAPAYLRTDERELRVKLRARARQLGDPSDSALTTGFARLVSATAYEHWHRMLFARFLAERGLLLHPHGVAVSLADCEDLAREEGAANGWVLAGRYASSMLPQIFRPDDPALLVTLPTEHQQALEKLLAALDPAVFQATDALGWVYQFWQAQLKDEVNKAGTKIGADEVSAVTQLFTEPYMVHFLLHNSLGAWWAGQVLAADPELAVTAPDEAALREACALPAVAWKYLRFSRGADGLWVPAAGVFAHWPKLARDFKVLDPCCGSGHFLVAMLEILGALRSVQEGLEPSTACDAVLRDNLHGLELDPRCTELAAFAVAVAAWTVPGGTGVRPLPELKIACSGQSLGVTRAEWRKLADGREELFGELDQLWNDFEKAPVIGSLLQPSRAMGSLFANSPARLREWLQRRALQERADADTHELAVAAFGAATAAELLEGQYHLIATNVPYLGRRKQGPALQRYSEQHYADAKADLANAFLDRCLAFAVPGSGVVQVVMPQNWLFLAAYAQQRKRLLRQTEWNSLARLGQGSFESPQAAGAFVILFTVSARAATAEHAFFGLDTESEVSPNAKAHGLAEGRLLPVVQAQQIRNPESTVTFSDLKTDTKLGDYAGCFQGAGLADIKRFRLLFWEIPKIANGWVVHQSSPERGEPHSGLHFVALWEDGKGALARADQARIQGRAAWGKPGVACAWMGDLPASLYGGWLFDNSAVAIVPKDKKHVPAIWAFVSSPEFNTRIREINQKVQVANGTMAQVTFNLAEWQAVADEQFPDGLPMPFTNDPTQWIFHGHPRPAVDPLQVAVTRLCGYQWPAETSDPIELSDEARALVAESAALSAHADADGIVCLPAIGGERSAADRLVALLADAWGKDWSDATLHRLLSDAGFADKGLEGWLEKAFFEQHCKRFHQRPFIWHVWDGVRDGFSALVNYHRLDRKALEKLTYHYLGDWIVRQEFGVRSGTDGAQDRLQAARNLRVELEKILEGERGYDVFVRWKPLAEQPIGWEPDLNDGGRLNIRPFVKARDVGQSGAGVLRWKPQINWDDDRGKDADDGPWNVAFAGKRVNEHSLTLAEKLAARAAKPHV